MLKNKSEYEIGNKLEEAYCSKPLQEEPSEETVAKWIAIAEQCRAERRRRNHKLISCAAALLMCVCVGVTCAVNKPNAVAGSTGGNKVEVGMETVDIYTSYDELPDDVKSDFLMFENIPEGYKFVECRVITDSITCERQASFIGNLGETMVIKEMEGLEDNSIDTIVSQNAEIMRCNGIDVYFNEYKNGAEEKTYRFIYNNIVVKISTSKEVEKDEIKKLIKNAVQS